MKRCVIKYLIHYYASRIALELAELFQMILKQLFQIELVFNWGYKSIVVVQSTSIEKAVRRGILIETGMIDFL
jgi:hypothetical protein